MENFNTLNLPETLINSLTAMNFNKPTPIQAATIPHALEGKDILGNAQTGTGKTGAFGIPLVSHILTNKENNALVLAPTRELAMQVLASIKQMLGNKTNIKTSLLIGGEHIGKQFGQLRNNPQIIVGTPGRINDHLTKKTLNLSKFNFLVLDEYDRMLDMGFSIQLEQIENFLPKKRQTLMFSATMANNILKLANSYLNNPVKVSIGSTNKATDTIKQELVQTSEEQKYGILLDKLNENSGSVIVFVKTKYATEKLAKKLKEYGHKVDAIHGDLRQQKRERVINDFRSNKIKILAATDVAARGLDINHVECVINYDLPQCPDDYLHRIGRTGRAGAKGLAISLITPQDGQKWKNIHKLMNPGEKNNFDSSLNSKKPSKKPFNNKNRKFGDKRKTSAWSRPNDFSSAKPTGENKRSRFSAKPKRFKKVA